MASIINNPEKLQKKLSRLTWVSLFDWTGKGSSQIIESICLPTSDLWESQNEALHGYFSVALQKLEQEYTIEYEAHQEASRAKSGKKRR